MSGAAGDSGDVARLLARALDMAPAAAVNEAGATAADVREYLDHHEWEVALDLLADLDDGWQPAVQWWDLLILMLVDRLDRGGLSGLGRPTGSR